MEGDIKANPANRGIEEVFRRVSKSNRCAKDIPGSYVFEGASWT
jgi:hypothetical protein